jgi:endonuclease/exonuclease/phosphatase family metal-dependent hydrolase
MTGGSPILIRALTWNIFHGLDKPPDSSLVTWRSRLFRVTEMDATHAQVNRPLRAEFAAMLASYDWDVALLQEAPPRWLPALARGAGACSAASALTARNFGAPLRGRLAELNPDLMGSWEGGSNQLLVRPPWRIVETRRLTLTRRPERRRMLWARLRGSGGATLAIANMHLTAHNSPQAGREALLAAEHAVAWAGEDPLIFGGDLNAPETFRELRERFGLVPEPEPKAIEGLLGSRVEVVESPRTLPPEARELPGPAGRLLRLSDHPPVVGGFELAESAATSTAGARTGAARAKGLSLT